MSSTQKPSDELHDQTLRQERDFPARLFGLSLSEAFRKFVLEDPEIGTLGTMIVREEGRHAEVFGEGQYPGAFINFVWPLDVTASDLAFQFVRPVVSFVPGPPDPEPSKNIQRVSGALVERLQSLRRMLADGDIVAHGTYVNTGAFGPINRLQWARDGVSIDVKSGDLLREINNHAAIQWSGLALEAPPASSMFHVNSTERDALRPSAISPSKGPPSASRITPHHASIEAAIAALWPEGIPMGLLLQKRDQKILDWQKSQGLAVASSKTIRRYLAAKAKSS